MCKTGEWIDSTLHQVINSYPEYYNYELYILDSDRRDAELFFLGVVSEVYKKYKNRNVSFTDEKNKIVWLEGTIKDLEIL